MTASTTTVTSGLKVRRASSIGLAGRRFLRQKTAMVALIFIVLEMLMAVFAPWIAPYDPYYSDYTATYQGPSREHWMGTDDLGRDVFARVVYGARVSLTVGILAVAVSVMIGLILGALSGFYGGCTPTRSAGRRGMGRLSTAFRTG